MWTLLDQVLPTDANQSINAQNKKSQPKNQNKELVIVQNGLKLIETNQIVPPNNYEEDGWMVVYDNNNTEKNNNRVLFLQYLSARVIERLY